MKAERTDGKLLYYPMEVSGVSEFFISCTEETRSDKDFVKNKASLPTAEKLLILWLSHLPRAVVQPKVVLTALNSEQRAEIPLAHNRVSAIPGEFVPVL